MELRKHGAPNIGGSNCRVYHPTLEGLQILAWGRTSRPQVSEAQYNPDPGGVADGSLSGESCLLISLTTG